MKKIQIVIFIISATLLSSCAVLNEKNRFLTNVIDEHLVPTDDSTAALLTPVAIPVGLLSMLIDGVILRPIRSLPTAFYDARYVFTEVDFMGPLEIFATPMRIISYPVFVVVDWVLRITTPLDWSN